MEDDLIFRSAVEARESLLIQVGKKNLGGQTHADSAVFMSTRSEDVGEKELQDTQAPEQTGGVSVSNLTSSELVLEESGVTQTQADDKPAEEPAAAVQVTES